MRPAVCGAMLAFAAPLGVQLARADYPVTPTEVRGVQIVSVEQARSLVGKIPFFDVRLPLNYGKGHIPTAVSAQYHQKSEISAGFDSAKDTFDMTKLPRDKALPILFYCGNPSGWKCYKAAVLAVRAGHTDVRWLRDGTVGWLAQGGSLE